MKSVDNITDPNDLIIEIEAKLTQYKLDKGLLIRETFTLWYILVEGRQCENFTEEEITALLKRNFELYQAHYLNDADFHFIFGWIINVAFWYLDTNLNEEYGNELLNKAYRSNPKNKLFTWAIRHELNLKDNEVNDLKIDIASRFEQFYNYGTFIKEYFLNVINTPH